MAPQANILEVHASFAVFARELRGGVAGVGPAVGGIELDVVDRDV